MFGFGAEIGISTQKLHARGPMGLRELTTLKYVVTGDGQVRVADARASARFESAAAVRDGLRAAGYLADDATAGVAYLADRLDKPVLVEGPAGTGKTELAKSVAAGGPAAG